MQRIEKEGSVAGRFFIFLIVLVIIFSLAVFVYAQGPEPSIANTPLRCEGDSFTLEFEEPELSETNLDFTFNLNSENAIEICQLYIDDENKANILTNINKNGQNMFNNIYVGDGSHELRILRRDNEGSEVNCASSLSIDTTTSTQQTETSQDTGGQTQPSAILTVTLLAPTHEYVTSNTILPFVAKFELNDEAFNSGKELQRATLKIWKVNRGKEMIENAKSILERELEEERDLTSIILQELAEEAAVTGTEAPETGTGECQDRNIDDGEDGNEACDELNTDDLEWSCVDINPNPLDFITECGQDVIGPTCQDCAVCCPSEVSQETEQETTGNRGELHTTVYDTIQTGISWKRDYSVLFKELDMNEIYKWNFEACTNDGVCKYASENFTLIVTEGGATTMPAPTCPAEIPDAVEGIEDFLDQIPEPVKIIGGIIIGFVVFSILSRFLPRLLGGLGG